ncbi:hypothetical protein VV11_021355 [Trichodesmium erythraeum 21-75]|nr:hypothetical protein [Trichodesmium erythraeum 21-75]
MLNEIIAFQVFKGNDIINVLESDDNVFGGKSDDFIVDDRGGNDNLL